MFKNILKYCQEHRVVTGIAAILVIVIGYYGYRAVFVKTVPPRYVLAAVEKGTLVSSVSGSGQIAVLNQVDLKAKTTEDVVYVGVKVGQEVKAGTLLVQINNFDAAKAVRDAKTSLETARLDLEDTLKPVDELTLLQVENSLLQLQESKQASKDDLSSAYESAFNAVVNSFFDLPIVMTDLDNLLHGYDINKSQENIAAYADMVKSYGEMAATQYKDTAASSYLVARTAYDANFQNFKNVNRSSDSAVIESLLGQTYETAKKISEAIKNADNLISYVSDTLSAHGLSAPKIATTHQATIRTDTGKVNSIISSLLSIRQTIQNDRDAIVKADRSIREKTLSNNEIKAGADELTIRAKRLAVQQKEDALLTAEQNLADTYVRAPFDGIVAKVGVKKGDSVSSGTSVATIITKQRIAEISLNEVDIAKVKVGQKVTLTFDAVSDLTVTGEVAEFDTLGTVSQGVVTYNVKIIFDTQDDRVKPGMSVSAAIINDVKQNVLMVPNSAIKELGGSSYVEVVDQSIGASAVGQASGITLGAVPGQARVEVGISNDTSTEITSGLKEGDIVVTRTVAAGATTQTKSSGSGVRLPGMGGNATFISR